MWGGRTEAGVVISSHEKLLSPRLFLEATVGGQRRKRASWN